MDMDQYLRSTEVIDANAPKVLELARSLAAPQDTPVDVARVCFEWVRDEISHSGDVEADVVTCRASEVLEARTGWCFAKSHLLAALLRANGIPAGFCYQRLRRDDGEGFTLHGLSAVYLNDHGWYRIDARGDKPGVNARFTPPIEQLAWPVSEPGEADLPEIWPDPLPMVVEYLNRCTTFVDAIRYLPDVPLTRR